MPRGRSGSGGNGGGGGMATGRGFTYDFGFAIARSDLRQLGLLTGATLSLTTAVYGLSKVTEEYTDSLKKSQLFFGGQLRTIKTMQWAQEQLLKGATEFNTSDIMQGMMQLQSVGVDAAKNFKFMSDAASATGQSFTQFSGAVSQAINGNMSGLVQMGLLTERATRQFDKYYANTTMRQKAILDFIHGNKALQAAITNNFQTISGQWTRLVEGVRMFAQNIMGDRHDPNSLYSRITEVLRNIGNWFHEHELAIKKAGTAIGMTLGWVVRQVGHAIGWLGKQFGAVLDYWNNNTKNFKERMYSFVLTLELWKDHIIGFIKDHREAFKLLAEIYLGGRYGGAILGFWGKLGGLASKLGGVMEGESFLAAAGRITLIGTAAVLAVRNWQPLLSILTDVGSVLDDIVRSLWKMVASIPGISSLLKMLGKDPDKKAVGGLASKLHLGRLGIDYMRSGPNDFQIGDSAEANRQAYFQKKFFSMVPKLKSVVNADGSFGTQQVGMQSNNIDPEKGRFWWQMAMSNIARTAYTQPNEAAFKQYVGSQLADVNANTGAFSGRMGKDWAYGSKNLLQSMQAGGLAAFQDQYEKASGDAQDKGYYPGGDIGNFGGDAVSGLSASTGGVDVQSGAITINIHKGDSIDEDQLAKLILKAIQDSLKKAAVRRGNQ